MVTGHAQIAKFEYANSAGTVIFKNSFPGEGWVGVSFVFDPADPCFRLTDYRSFLSSAKRMMRKNGNGRDLMVEVPENHEPSDNEIPVIYIRGKNWASHPTRVSTDEAQKIVSVLREEAEHLTVDNYYYLPIFA